MLPVEADGVRMVVLGISWSVSDRTRTDGMTPTCDGPIAPERTVGAG